VRDDCPSSSAEYAVKCTTTYSRVSSFTLLLSQLRIRALRPASEAAENDQHSAVQEALRSRKRRRHEEAQEVSDRYRVGADHADRRTGIPGPLQPARPAQ